MAVLYCSSIQYDETRPIRGMKMMKVVLSQLTCWYQLATVMGCSVMSAGGGHSSAYACNGYGCAWYTGVSSGPLTGLADVVVLLPHGDVVGGAVGESLGLGDRDLGRRRRHGEGREEVTRVTNLQVSSMRVVVVVEGGDEVATRMLGRRRDDGDRRGRLRCWWLFMVDGTRGQSRSGCRTKARLAKFIIPGTAFCKWSRDEWPGGGNGDGWMGRGGVRMSTSARSLAWFPRERRD